MRELRFRQWYNGRFHYFGYVDGECSGPCSASLSSHPIEQFTGLYDKYHVGIFEGDILLDKYGNIVKCYWEPSNWVFLNTGGSVQDGHQWEIIGNIHQENYKGYTND